ncbi:hypothetical protein [Pseudomonas fluorescens]|uniref:hypothetical protein n=1 Tax=Pseudomonas fluorescens TaxID=294 RepID=UPI00163B169F|nr:hypothetical protein [Pseudomonas fluorescens]
MATSTESNEQKQARLVSEINGLSRDQLLGFFLQIKDIDAIQFQNDDHQTDVSVPPEGR